MAFKIIRNDITQVCADAIVNTANPEPTYAGGTDAAIYKAAGKEKLLEERKKIGAIEVGKAVETPVFQLNAKYIIHTVMDAVEVAGRFGVKANRAVRYECDGEGTKLNFEVMSRIVSCARSADCVEDMEDCLDEDELLAPIRADYDRRHSS